MATNPNIFGPLNGPNIYNDLSGIGRGATQGLSKQEYINTLALKIQSLTLELEKLTLDEPLLGPTQRQLNNDEALRNSWEAFMIVKKLKGI